MKHQLDISPQYFLYFGILFLILSLVSLWRFLYKRNAYIRVVGTYINHEMDDIQIKRAESGEFSNAFSKSIFRYEIDGKIVIGYQYGDANGLTPGSAYKLLISPGQVTRCQVDNWINQCLSMIICILLGIGFILVWCAFRFNWLE